MNKQPLLRFPEFTGEWEETSLNELLSFKNGINAPKEKYGKGTKFINVSDILNTDYLTYDKIEGSVEVSKEQFDNYSVSYGDVVFQRSSETREEVGTSNVYLDNDKSCVFGGFVIRGKKIEEYEPFFLKELLTTSSVRKDITSRSGGSTRYNIGQESLKVVKIKVPSIPEQQKIADFLLKVDEKIKMLYEKLVLWEKYKKGMLQQVLSQKLRFKDENGEDYQDWNEKSLGELGQFFRGHSYNSQNVVENGLLVLRSNNIQNSDLDLSGSQLQFVNNDCGKEKKLRKNDIVICMNNGSEHLVGKNAKYHGNYNHDVTVGAFCSIFRTANCLVEYLLQTDDYRKKIHLIIAGTNIHNLKNSEMENFTFNIPVNKKEEQKICSYLSALDKKRECISKELKINQNFKKGLLQKMFC